MSGLRQFWRELQAHPRLSRFFLGEAPSKTAIHLNHRRIFIVPTRQGFGFTLLIVVLLLIGFVYNNNLTYLLAFLLIGLLIVTILHTFRSLSGLVMTIGAAKSVFVGERALLPLYIENPSQVKRYHLEISLEESVFVDVEARGVQQVSVYSTTLRRGWHQCGTIRVTCRFPLGLFRAWSLLRFACPVVVYPKPAASGVAFPEQATGEGQQGQAHRGGVEDFYGLLEYRAGDAIKHIHWKSYAKTQGLFTKHYSHYQASELSLDYAHTPGYGVEERLSQLCRWVMDAEACARPYSLSLPGCTLPPGCGEQHYVACLQALALF